MSVIDITKNEVIMEMIHNLEEKGRTDGQEEGIHFGIQETLRSQLKTKFGRVPVWAQERLTSATSQQLEQWCQNILAAGTIEEVLGKR